MEVDVSEDESSTHEDRMEEDGVGRGGPPEEPPPDPDEEMGYDLPGSGFLEEGYVDEMVEHMLLNFLADPVNTDYKLKQYLAWAVPYCFKLRKTLSPLDKLQPQDGNSPRAEALLFPVLKGFLNKNEELNLYFQVLWIDLNTFIFKQVSKSKFLRKHDGIFAVARRVPSVPMWKGIQGGRAHLQLP